jgi:hypothetical protein
VAEHLQQSRIVMPARKTLDRHPGAMPDIQTDGESVTFSMDVTIEQAGVRLVIRCGAGDDVWASISPPLENPHER